MNTPTPFPVRKQIRHTAPFQSPNAFYFVTVCAAQRGTFALTDNAAKILDAARHLQSAGRWFLSLFLVMPDHLHLLVHVPPPAALSMVVRDFKRYLKKTCGLSFQRGYFDVRIRDPGHYAEKWRYIVMNPVVRGFASSPREWPHVIAFDRTTGKERPHR